MHIPFSKMWGWVRKRRSDSTRMICHRLFLLFLRREKPVLAACSGVAPWGMCQVHKQSPGRTGQPAEGQALRIVLFVSTTPRARYVQCHQLAGDEITVSATQHLCPPACISPSLVAHWKGGLFPNSFLLVVSFRTAWVVPCSRDWSPSLPHRKSCGTKTLPCLQPDLETSSTWGQSWAELSPFDFTRSLRWHLHPPGRGAGELMLENCFEETRNCFSFSF